MKYHNKTEVPFVVSQSHTHKHLLYVKVRFHYRDGLVGRGKKHSNAETPVGLTGFGRLLHVLIAA